ncbi:MAG: SixA phosphatase family protein [Acidimicrobiales bacterium]
MTILLVRHARAGRRDKWRGDDRLRPLTKRGRAQAEALAVQVAPWLGENPELLSSPWLRCVQTLGPLAEPTGSEIGADDVLGEGMGTKAVEALAGWLKPHTVVVCTHGDVIEAILAALAEGGVDLGRNPRTAKGSVWVLDGDAWSVHAAKYLAPV